MAVLFTAVFFLVLQTVHIVLPYRILMYHDMGTKSHLHLYYPLAEQLLQNGHEVTGVYYGSAKIKHENYNEVLIKDVQALLMKNLSAIYMEEGNSDKPLINPSLIWRTWHMKDVFMNSFADTLGSKDIEAVLSNPFDVVISGSLSAGYLAERLNCSIVFLSPPGPMHLHTNLLGNRFNPALSPTLGISFTDPSQFSQRLENLVVSQFMSVWSWFFCWQLHDHTQTKLNYTGPPFHQSLVNRIEILLSNSHPITHDPQPFLQNVVHVGGLHIKPSKPLPDDLQKVLDENPEGVIFVSFGSSITPSSMSEDKRKAFIKAFELLKIPVIWKWDSAIPEQVPKNVILKDWLPQQDLLAHPNLKVFISHGGLLSIMEAIYFETTIIGIPLANDQKPNLSRLESKNLGIRLSWDNISAEVLVDAVQRALQDKDMRASLQQASKLFKDARETPAERAAWWIEFVIRNKGAAFLRPLSENLPWYKAWNLDILLVFLFGLAVSLYIIWKLIRFCRFCCRCLRSFLRKLKRD